MSSATPTKGIDTSSIVQGLNQLVSVSIDTAQLTAVLQKVVESVQLLNEDVSRLTEDIQTHRAADKQENAQQLAATSTRLAQEIATTRSTLEESLGGEISGLRNIVEAHREGVRVEIDAIQASVVAQRSAQEEQLAKMDHDTRMNREGDLTRISAEIDATRASSQTAYNSLADEVQKNRDAVKLMNDEQVRREADSLAHRKRRDEEEARIREDRDKLAREINALRRDTDSLETGLVGVRADVNHQLQKQTHMLENKADKEVVSSSYDMLIAHTGTNLEELRNQVSEKFRVLEEHRTLTENQFTTSIQQLNKDRDTLHIATQELAADRDRMKVDADNCWREARQKREADVERIQVLNKHAEQSTEKFVDLDKVLEGCSFRLSHIERELAGTQKDVGVLSHELGGFKTLAAGGPIGLGQTPAAAALLFGGDGRRNSFGAHVDPNMTEADKQSLFSTSTAHLASSGGSPTASSVQHAGPAAGGPGGTYGDYANNSREALLSRLAERDRDRESMREALNSRWKGGGGTPLRMGPLSPPLPPAPSPR